MGRRKNGNWRSLGRECSPTAGAKKAYRFILGTVPLQVERNHLLAAALLAVAIPQINSILWRGRQALDHVVECLAVLPDDRFSKRQHLGRLVHDPRGLKKRLVKC